MKPKSFRIGDFDSSNYFAVVEDIQISPLTHKLNTISLPERDGVLDFSKDNMWGRDVFEPRIITITGILRWSYWAIENNYPENDKMVVVSALYNAAHKNQKGNLYLSTTPGVYWEATLEAIENLDSVGMTSFRAVLQYRCQPLSKDEEEFVINQDAGPVVQFTLPDAEDFAPMNSFTVEVTSTDEDTAGVVIINTRSGEQLDIGDIDLTGINKLVVDFENFNIDYTPKLYAYKTWRGDFFELKPGDNLAVQTTLTNGTVILKYRPQYFYGKMAAMRE